uniref:Uncharacterized protein n=1 Tax=Meleagris gallopavo TaxID=9103 RepID=A0A803XT61_MELGA
QVCCVLGWHTSLNEWLWQHEFWLPPGITWEDMKESEDIHYPKPRDLLLSIPFALILVVIRCVFESVCWVGFMKVRNWCLLV